MLELTHFTEHKMSEFKIEHNVETNEVTKITLTAEELEELKSARIIAQAEETERTAAEAAKAAEKETLLTRLGITADEAKLLLS